MTTRRHALGQLVLLCGVPAIAASKAQPKRIGVISEGKAPANLEAEEARFWAQMRRRGWVLGENVLAQRTFANWNLDYLPAQAQELVRMRVDVIICVAGQDAMVAAARATRSIPIVFYDATVPVERGMVESFRKPGRNLTGVSIISEAEYVIKRLELLRAIAPSATRLSWLWGHDTLSLSKVDGGRYDFAASLAEVARKLQFETRFHLFDGPVDLARAFQDATSWRAQALTASGDRAFEMRQDVVQFALRQRLPSAFNSEDFVQEGGLLSYGIPNSESGLLLDVLVSYVDRILRGATPANMPVVGPSRYEVTINLKTAQSLGLSIPESLISRADRLVR